MKHCRDLVNETTTKNSIEDFPQDENEESDFEGLTVKEYEEIRKKRVVISFPGDVHLRLSNRAKEAGQTMQEYLRRNLNDEAGKSYEDYALETLLYNKKRDLVAITEDVKSHRGII